MKITLTEKVTKKENVNSEEFIIYTKKTVKEILKMDNKVSEFCETSKFCALKIILQYR